ncbi:TetR/AcrR family transcriptional regulator [Frigoriglobus tundricola]|uniref:Transcriptional regulator, AcrR family n=1 Tax=Frigoriglobus tundricola TaxID=2774151 RepID=A0A6M5YZS8_9BACT|nr:TetR/AcrR family transcriptional regulator [Frigoriglobus tundricola]QJW99455.1 Transcriptional regulator, AcrR family [Frigoriglobus tundricola]
MGGTPARGNNSRKDDACARRREELLSAAAKVFARSGYPGTEVQEIAAACGLAKGTVYLYFPSKEELFLATVDRAMIRLCHHVRETCAGIDDPLDRLAAAVRSYFAFFQSNPEIAELLIIERAEYRDRKTPTYLEHKRENTKDWQEVYAGLIRDGRFRAVPVERISRVVSDLLYGTMFTNHFSGGQRTPNEQARDVLDILFEGLLTPAERETRASRERATVPAEQT